MTREEILQKISDKERYKVQVGNDLDKHRGVIAPQLDSLKEEIEKKEEEKKAITKKGTPAFMWVIMGVLLFFFFSFNMNDEPVLGILSLVAGLALLVFNIFKNVTAGKIYEKKLAPVENELKELNARYDALLASHPEIATFANEYARVLDDIHNLQLQLKYLDMLEKIGENCAVIYYNEVCSSDRITVTIDGKDLGQVPRPIAIYPLEPGVHSLHLDRIGSSTWYHTETVQFRIDGNAKFLGYKFEYYGSTYNCKVSDSFDAFVKENELTEYQVDQIRDYITSL